jgi:hypothetical protein
MRGGVNNYLILQYAKLIFGLYQAVASPPPWTVEELDACFVVKDSAGRKLAFVCYEEERVANRRTIG